MTFIITALKAEAQPFIDFYSLKIYHDNIYKIYSHNNIFLIISGIGKINAAIGTAYLLTKFDAQKSNTVLNIGTCGCFDKNIPIGSLFLIHKIIDHASAGVFHTKIQSPLFQTISITCFDKPLSSVAVKAKTKLVDMESFGYYQAAKKFIDKEDIYLIKAVSDHICDKIPSSDFVYKLFEKEIERVDELIK